VDKNVWKTVRNAIRSAERVVRRTGRRRQYSDRQVVQMFFWSVGSDRARCFACRRESYPSWIRFRSLPSYSQFCRRLHCPRVVAMIKHVATRLGEIGAPVRVVMLDGMELPVRWSSRDPDARASKCRGRWAKGYKLHAMAGSDQRIKAFAVRPLNEGEPNTAREHLMPKVPHGGRVLADANYDSRHLDAAAAARQARFMAPIKKNRATTRSRTSRERMRRVQMWERHGGLMMQVHRRRTVIERVFSALTGFGGGLTTLPAWVRRQDRVELWVAAKVAIYNARVLRRTIARAA
jgi:hypothetical protein